MQPDEIQRMDNKQCIVLLRGQKPMLLYKIIPDEFPAFQKLRPTPVSEHIPVWRARLSNASEKPVRQFAPEPPKAEPEPAPAPQPEAKPPEFQDGPEPRFAYDFINRDDDLGMVEKGVSSVLGEDEPDGD